MVGVEHIMNANGCILYLLNKACKANIKAETPGPITKKVVTTFFFILSPPINDLNSREL